MGVIPGHIGDEIVILGNHRDAWVNGAADPTSGTVTIVELSKGWAGCYEKGGPLFGRLLSPAGMLKRYAYKSSVSGPSMRFGEPQYGLIGSTEYDEDFTDFLAEYVVAYLNVGQCDLIASIVLVTYAAHVCITISKYLSDVATPVLGSTSEDRLHWPTSFAELCSPSRTQQTRTVLCGTHVMMLDLSLVPLASTSS